MLTHTDNFSLYGVNGQLRMLEGVYANNHGTSVTVDPDPNAPAGSLAANVNNFGHLNEGFRRIEDVDDTVVGASWRWWVDSVPQDDNDRPVVKFLNPVAEPVVSITLNVAGGVDIRNGDTTGPVVASSDGPVITARGWYHFEVRVDSTADGNVEVRVEGRTVATILHQNYSTTLQQFMWGMWSAAGPLYQCYYKDLTTWNSLGAHNNDFLGSVLVINLEPVADVALNWTPSTGANGFSILDNIPPDDTKYIQADNPPPAPYKCSFAPLPPEITGVRAVMSVVRAGKFDGGDGSLQNGLISSATLVNGSDRPITVTQTYWRDIFETDPHTAAPWLPAAVNAVQMQVNRTT